MEINQSQKMQDENCSEAQAFLSQNLPKNLALIALNMVYILQSLSSDLYIFLTKAKIYASRIFQNT